MFQRRSQGDVTNLGNELKYTLQKDPLIVCNLVTKKTETDNPKWKTTTSSFNSLIPGICSHRPVRAWWSSFQAHVWVKGVTVFVLVLELRSPSRTLTPSGEDMQYSNHDILQ